MSNTKKIILVRHGKSPQNFPGSHILSKDEIEFLRPLAKEAEIDAKILGKEIIDKNIQSNKILGVHSKLKRSHQTLVCLLDGFDTDSIELLGDNKIYSFLDEGYLEAAKKCEKEEYKTIIDYILNVKPSEFFRKHGIKDFQRTMSAKEIQDNMKIVLRGLIDEMYFREKDFAVVAGHEPGISLLINYSTGKSIKELGGKCKELEYATFIAEKNSCLGYPTTIVDYKRQTCDITEKLFS